MTMELSKHCILLSFCAVIFLPISFSEHFELSSSPSVTGKLDSDVVLPCQISLGTQPQNMEVQWKKIGSTHVSIYQFSTLAGWEILGEEYQGRVIMARNGLATGNVSLILTKVRVLDEGTYSCIVKSTDWSADTQTVLHVTAVGNVSIEILGPEDNGIKVVCRSAGWFPKPELHWLTNDKQIGDQLESKQDQKQLFSVSSSITVLKDTGEITCLVIGRRSQTGKTFTVSLSGNIFPSISPWLPAFWILFILAGLCFGVAAYHIHQEKQKEHSEEQEKMLQDVQTKTKDAEFHMLQLMLERAHSELDFRKARSYMVRDHLELQDIHIERAALEEQRNVHQHQDSPPPAVIMVGIKGFEEERQYWEVRVEDKMDWELGVLTEETRNKLKQGNVGAFQEDQHWSLRRRNENYWPMEANDRIQEYSVELNVVGIYLNRKDHLAPSVSFYHVSAMKALVTLPVKTGKLYPFISSGRFDGGHPGKSLTICQDQDWDFPEQVATTFTGKNVGE